MNIIEATEQIMAKLHEGQFRKNYGKDGEKIPYIVHPKAVRQNAVKIYPTIIKHDEYLIDVQVVALAHDLEDTPVSEEKFVWMLQDILGDNDYTHFMRIRAALDIMNKNNHKNYLEYILTAKTNPISRVVKLADLEDNLSDLKPGSLRDKYLMAQYILLN